MFLCDLEGMRSGHNHSKNMEIKYSKNIHPNKHPNNTRTKCDKKKLEFTTDNTLKMHEKGFFCSSLTR
jgi:hypothetical protein